MPNAQQKKQLSITSRIVSASVLCMLAFIVLWAANAIQTAVIPSASMAPTLLPGDIVLVRKNAYQNGHRPVRGDIVMFRREGISDYFVKRVIALPGERVTVRYGAAAVNGQWLNEPYIAPGWVREIPVSRVVNEDEYYVLGDNRANAEDSRDYGPIAFDSIAGQITAVIAPYSRRGRIVPPFPA